MVRTVKLNSSDNALSGKYRSGEMVLVECDATNGAFSVTMPDAKTTEKTLFWITKWDSSANLVTVAFRDAQSGDGQTSLVIREQYDDFGLVSDGSTYAVVSGGVQAGALGARVTGTVATGWSRFAAGVAGSNGGKYLLTWTGSSSGRRGVALLDVSYIDGETPILSVTQYDVES